MQWNEASKFRECKIGSVCVKCIFKHRDGDGEMTRRKWPILLGNAAPKLSRPRMEKETKNNIKREIALDLVVYRHMESYTVSFSAFLGCLMLLS